MSRIAPCYSSLPRTVWLALSYKICPLLAYSNCYWEVHIYFRRERGDFLLNWVSVGIIIYRKGSFQWWPFLEKFYTERIWNDLQNEILFSVFLSLFQLNLFYKMFWGNLPGEIFGRFRFLRIMYLERWFLDWSKKRLEI